MALPTPYWKQPGYKRPGNIINTWNLWEQAAIRKLTDEGWRIYKKGWPDFVAFKDDAIRFIEVKPPTGKNRRPRDFAPDQRRIAKLLKKFYGIQVELWNSFEQLGVERPKPSPLPISVPRKKYKAGYGEHLIKFNNKDALVKAGLIEPMGAGERVSGATVESPRVMQENALSLGRD